MTSAAERRARSNLDALQTAVDSREVSQLVGLFAESSVLVGTARAARTPAERREYLTAVVSQPERLRWEWRDVEVFHDAPDIVGAVGFGDIVLRGDDGERRAPIRATVVAVERPDGWKLQHFHGSIPSDL